MALARRLANRRVLGTLAGLLVLGFLGAALVDGWRGVSRFDWSLHPLWLAGGLLALLAAYLLAGLLYAGIVERLQEPAPARRAMVSVWARSLLGRYVPGTVVMVLGRTVMGQRAGVPGRVTLAATTYEQALSLAAAGVASIGFLLAYGDLGQRAWTWAAILIVPVALAPLHPRIFRPLSAWALARARREPLPAHLSGGAVAAFLGGYLLSMAILAVGTWALVHAAVGGEAGGPAYVGLAYVLAFLVSTLLFVFPSGLGVREGAFALVLAQVLPTGVAVACAVGVRLVITLVELLFVALAAAAGRR